jgi:alpha-amylase/alpha-mannosidase (GH57 family)
MHQPYYKNLLTQEADLPWVRLHGVKDYLDMLQLLEKYPRIQQTFNLVPALLEQIEDYDQGRVKDKFLELSLKPAGDLTAEEKAFILNNFFSINKEKVISLFPRYYELYFKQQLKKEFTTQDYLDLQLLFNLCWIDPLFRQSFPELKQLIYKARFFSEAEKRLVLDKQLEILAGIIPAYQKFSQAGQVELSCSPYYHPILPLLYNTQVAKEANPKTALPKNKFSFPEDAQEQITLAISYFQEKFGRSPSGMWPSEQAVSEHILRLLIEAGVSWIVTDEAILFKSLKKKRRDARLVYQPYLLKRKAGSLNIIFRDRNLSDLLGFVYHKQEAKAAVDDFMRHLEDIAQGLKDKDILVTVALDGENAWEYYSNDGRDFLELLYQRLSDSRLLKTTTIADYLKSHPAQTQIKHLAAGSWIYGEFGKWIGNLKKVKAWEYLAQARQELVSFRLQAPGSKLELAWKQIYILEGSDWFWWAGEDPTGDFDRLFRMHLKNFYTLVDTAIPAYLDEPL